LVIEDHRVQVAPQLVECTVMKTLQKFLHFLFSGPIQL